MSENEWNNKYNIAFDFVEKTLLVFPATNGGVSIASYFTANGATSANFGLVSFLLLTELWRNR